MAEQYSNKQLRKALKAYGKTKGYTGVWRQRTYDWLKQMRDTNPEHQSYQNSIKTLFGDQEPVKEQTFNTQYATTPKSTQYGWSATNWWDNHYDTPEFKTNTTFDLQNTEEVEEPIKQEEPQAIDYSYGGTGKGFWNTSAQSFISNLNKTEAGRGALKGYDTNGDNIISEDELKAMQEAKNLTTDAKIGSRTLGAFKDLMNEEDYNSSLNTYNNWLNSRKVQSTTASTDNTGNANTLTQDQQDYNNMTAGVSTEGANLNRYKTGTQQASTTPSDMSDYSSDPKAPNNNPDNGFGNMYQGNDGQYYPKESSPWFTNVNGTYVKKSNQEYQQNPNNQQPGVLTNDWNTEKQVYKALGKAAMKEINEPIIAKYAQWASNLLSARNILKRTHPFNMPKE